MYGQIHDQINVANRILISHVRRMWPLHFDQLFCSRRSIMFFPCSLSSQVVRCFAAGIAIQHQQLLDEIVSTGNPAALYSCICISVQKKKKSCICICTHACIGRSYHVGPWIQPFHVVSIQYIENLVQHVVYSVINDLVI